MDQSIISLEQVILSLMKKKIVLISAFLRPLRSGAEAMVEEVSVRLHDHYTIVIVTARMQRKLPKEDLLDGVVRVRRVGVGIFFIDKWLFPIFAFFAVRREKPDLIHAVLESFAGFTLTLCKLFLRKPKRLLTLQSTNTKLFLRSIHRSAHAITGISSVLLLRARQFGRDDVIYIPNGIDLPALQASCTRFQRVRGRILFVGRLEHVKGVDTLLLAFSELTDTTLTLTIVGDGSERDALQKQAQQLRIADRTEFLGKLTPLKVYDQYASAEIFVGLSRSEALGNVFLEAQAAGCAVVASNVGGIPEIVKDQVTGILVPPEDPDMAAQAIHQLLTNVPLRTSLTAAAQEHVKVFDWRLIAERYKKVYEGLIG